MKERLPRLIRNLLALSAAALFLAGAAALCSRAGGGGSGADASRPDTLSVLRDTIYIRDTLFTASPPELRTVVVRDTVVAAPAAGDTSVTAEVSLPVLSRHYGDSLYEAWVSGPVDPRLDSVRVYPVTSVVTERVTIRDPPRRWGLSAGLGVTATPRGIEPGVFVGVTYTFAAFGGN